MKRLFDLALLCAMIVVVFYACSEDVFSPYEGNLVFNSNDPRLEMIASVDSAKRMESHVETLAFGESIFPQDHVKVVPIYSGSRLNINYTVYVQIDYHTNESGLTILGTQAYLRASGAPYPVLEIYTCDLYQNAINSRTYYLNVRGQLDCSNMYIGIENIPTESLFEDVRTVNMPVQL